MPNASWNWKPKRILRTSKPYSILHYERIFLNPSVPMMNKCSDCEVPVTWWVATFGYQNWGSVHRRGEPIFLYPPRLANHVGDIVGSVGKILYLPQCMIHPYNIIRSPFRNTKMSLTIQLLMDGRHVPINNSFLQLHIISEYLNRVCETIRT